MSGANRVLVTWATGFVGRRVCNELRNRGYEVYGWKRNPDLLDISSIEDFLDAYPVDYCIHLAAHNGGIVYNGLKQAALFYDNTLMGLNLLTVISQHKPLKRCLLITTSCCYTDNLSDYIEDQFHAGKPNHSVQYFASAKRNLEIYGRAINEENKYDKFVTACVTNLYGPGDTFDLQKTKVIGALVKKFVDAVEDGVEEVVLFGDGSPLRDFLYVKDAAESIVDALLLYKDTSLPINIGSGTEISIKDIAALTAELVGYKGSITWDTSKPNGQHRKTLNTDRMKQYLPDRDKTSLKDGLTETIKYYRSLPWPR